jgi:hypothetical protein
VHAFTDRENYYSNEKLFRASMSVSRGKIMETIDARVARARGPRFFG